MLSVRARILVYNLGLKPNRTNDAAILMLKCFTVRDEGASGISSSDCVFLERAIHVGPKSASS